MTGNPDDIEARKEAAAGWFRELRDRLRAEFEAIEDEAAKDESAKDESEAAPAGRFEAKAWERDGGGGGEMSVLRGRVFEKVGVNISTVFGEFPEEFAKQMPGAADDARFWAGGISLVAHMRSPLVPAAHMNTRFIVTTKQWFGGGGDLTPTFPVDEDTEDFHGTFRAACEAYEAGSHERYKKWCDEYFFLPHRDEPRGVGGIFYDNLDSGDWNRDFEFTRNVGLAFLEAFPRIVRRRMNQSWTEEQRQALLVKRGRYVEFNLLHDRGTQFGIRTGGNTEAILMSLPPEVKWP